MTTAGGSPAKFSVLQGQAKPWTGETSSDREQPSRRVEAELLLPPELQVAGPDSPAAWQTIHRENGTL